MSHLIVATGVIRWADRRAASAVGHLITSGSHEDNDQVTGRAPERPLEHLIVTVRNRDDQVHHR